jgi:phage/plasmid-associated DNA primase
MTHEEITEEVAKIVSIATPVEREMEMKALAKRSGITLRALYETADQLHKTRLDTMPNRPPQTHGEAAVQIAAMFEPALIFDEGQFWQPDEAAQVWNLYPQQMVVKEVHDYYWPKGYDLAKRQSDTKAIAEALTVELARPGFFAAAPEGIAVEGTFIGIDDEWVVRQELRLHEHRVRAKAVLPISTDTPSAWLAVLDHHLEDPRQIARLQEAMGLTILGAFNRTKRAMMLIGEGDTSKTMVLQALQDLVPKALTSTVPLHQLGHERYIIDLAGKLLNVAGEINPHHPVDDAAFKSLTGGDPVTGRAAYALTTTTFVSRAAIWCAGNRTALVRDRSDAFFDRFLMLDFRNPVDPSVVKRSYYDRVIRPELGSILNWALLGAEVAIMRGTITSTGEIEEDMKAEWRMQNDSVRWWLLGGDGSFMVSGDQKHGVRGASLYGVYHKETRSAGMMPLSNQSFYKALRDGFWLKQGVTVVRTKEDWTHVRGVRMRIDLAQGSGVMVPMRSAMVLGAKPSSKK